MRIISVVAATGAGAALGWVCAVLPMWPVARLAAASLMGSFVGAVVVVVSMFLILSRSGSGGLGAVSFGLSEAVLLGVPTVGLIAVVGYFALRWLGWSAASLATYGPIICGGGTALLTALWVARGMEMSGGR